MLELYRSLTRNIHPGSLAVAIAFDLLWSGGEGLATLTGWGVILLIFFSITVFVASFGAVTLIQRFGSADEWSSALTKGLIIGVLSAIPYSFIGLGVAAFWMFMRLTVGVDQETILLGKLTQNWREIEIILRKLAPPDVRNANLDEVINCLHSRHLLSSSLKDKLHDLRRQRNINMHEISTQELANLVDEVQAMHTALRTRFLNA
jgi:hypothetical protein